MMSSRILWLAAGTCALNICSASALDRPAWMDEPGIVMAGSWEEPTFRARRMGRLDYTLPPERLADYAREHSPEMIAQLKALGVNFVMIHCYKGAGMETERQGMEDTKRFADLAHKAGMRVGAYIGGTMLYERLFKEEPNAPQWQALGPTGEPLFYSAGQKFRYVPVRNHPGFIEYLKKPVRYAVEEVHADLIHFDNYDLGSGSYDPTSKQQFRSYLKAHGMAEAKPPTNLRDRGDPLVRAWLDFKCQTMADHYAAMSQYVRSLNPKCAVECNPMGVGNTGRAANGVDHARLLSHGNAFWIESGGPSWNPITKTARTRIVSYKVGQLYNNVAFDYVHTPLDAAESMAFNMNCFGQVAWFEWGKVQGASILTNRPVRPELRPYIRFYLDHQDLFRHSKPIADVAVLRTFAESNFASAEEQVKRLKIEEGLITSQAAWRPIFDQQLGALDEYRMVIAPDKKWLAPEQQRNLAEFVAKGGRVASAAESQIPPVIPAPRIAVQAPPSVAIELRQQEQPRRVLIHFVNYNTSETISNIPVKLRIQGSHPSTVRLLSPDPAGEQSVSLREDGAIHLFTLLQLKVYAIAIIEGDRK